jgi:hypothetical protein
MLYPVPGGPSLAQLGATLQSLATTQNIVAMSMTVWDFKQDADKKTEQACLQLLQSLIGGEQ